MDCLRQTGWGLVAKMINSPLVSVLISAYNEEKYIQACIESCLEQTYNNIEIIIVNDGSTDSTSEIINQHYQKNFKVNIIELKEKRKRNRSHKIFHK